MAEQRLLIIDDDPIVRSSLSAHLGEAGYEVLEARDGEEGLETTRLRRPGFVLCDWLMPRTDGLEYCRRVKSDAELQTTHVAILTGRGETRDRVQALNAGADEVIVKPVPVDELLARVRAGLRVRRLQRELVDARQRAALSELAVTMGHEINNPLTALFGHLELVVQYLEHGDRGRMQAHLEQAGVVASRIAEVVQRLQSIDTPRTKAYLGSLRMLDLDLPDSSGPVDR